jgi:hypothetical protein
MSSLISSIDLWTGAFLSCEYTMMPNASPRAQTPKPNMRSVRPGTPMNICGRKLGGRDDEAVFADGTRKGASPRPACIARASGDGEKCER